MSRATFYPTAGGDCPRGAPPFRPEGYWATVKWASALVGAETRRALAAEAEIARSVPVLDDSVTEGSANGVKSSGVWAFAKGLLPAWLVPGYEEPASAESVASAVQSVSEALGDHAADTVAHVTEGDRAEWNDKYTKREVDDKLVGLTGEDIPVSSTDSAKVSDAISAKRGLTDFDVDGGFGDWQIVGTGAEHYRIVYNSALRRYEWQVKSGPAEGTVDRVEASELDDKTRLEFSGMVATRSAVSAKIARTAELTAGGLAKFGADGVLEKATASSAGGEAADYRDPLDNTCHKTTSVAGEWSTVTKDGDVWSVYCHDTSGRSECILQLNGISYPNSSTKDVGDDTATTLTWVGGGVDCDKDFDITFTRTFTTLASKGHTFVTEDIAARSLECGEGDAKQTVTVENGVAKLDDFFGESNSLLTGTIATKSIPAFSSSSTYEVGEIVVYDGVAYKCVTAITTVEEWTAAHWTLATNSDLAARLKGLKSDGTATDAFVTDILGKQVAKEAIDEEIIEKGTAPDAHLEAPTDEHLKLILADNSVAYDSGKALPYKLTSVIGNRVIATMTLTAASTDITLPTIAANDTTVKDFILDVTNAYAVEGVATDAGINIPRTDFKLVTRDGESLTDVTTVKAGKSAFICFTQKSPVVVDGTTYPCWCVIQLPFGDPS